MSQGEVISLILAATSVIGSLLGLMLLGFRIGRLIGKVESAIERFSQEDIAVRNEIARVAAQLERHEDWHRAIMTPARMTP